MVRTIAATALVAAALGFGIGWLMPKGGPTPEISRRALKPTPESVREGPVEVSHQFALRPADVSADRETPALAVAPGGAVVVAWASQTGESERTLYLARSDDGGTTFSAPTPWRKVPIYRYASGAEGRKMTFSTHVLPRLAAGPDALYLGWVEAVDGGPEVRYYVAQSGNGGKTFSDPVPAHGDGASRPGFTTLWADPAGGVACGWIDARNKAQQPFFSAWAEGSEGFGPESLVYAPPDGRGICPCCDVAVSRAATGATFVAFRNNDSGHRDIWIARADRDGTGAFGPPKPVSRDPWTFDGCPHDAPALATEADRLHVTWMDAHSGRNRVYFASSPVAELSFEPRELAPESRGSQGHPRLVASAVPGVLHAVWDESLNPAEPAPASKASGHGHGPDLSGGGRAIMYACSRDGDAHFGQAVALAPRLGAYQIQPALAAGPGGVVYAAWNELDQDGKHVIFVRLAGHAGRP